MATIIAQQLSAGCVPFRDPPSSRARRGAPRAAFPRPSIGPVCHRCAYSTHTAAREGGARASGSSRPSAAPRARVDRRSEHAPAAPSARFTDDPRLTDHAPSIRVFSSRLTQKSRTVRPRSVAAKARASVRVGAVAAARPNYFPGTTPPKHLDGTMPGDFGFDPLNLGEDKEALAWYQQAELMHARWAMLGVTGMAAPEIIGNPFVEGPLPNWYDAPLWDGYMASPNTLFVVQMFMMNWAEVRRWQDMKNPGSMNEDPLTGANKGDTNTDVGYPKGLFDPMGYAKDPKKAEELKLKEIKNGRLAMVACMGCIIQQEATGVGPVANLKAHLADPAHNTIFNNFTPIAF
jgi:hypothetical protein